MIFIIMEAHIFIELYKYKYNKLISTILSE